MGMAANMIGVNKRIIAFDNIGEYMVMFNPVIVKKSAPYDAEEGCLSLTGTRKTKRYQTIKVQWQNEQFQTRIKTFTGWTAQIIQHEIDHCEGSFDMILYFSGTGNSKYVAKRIADALGDALVNLNDRIKASDTSPVETGERVIIVTPTYAWRIPRVVRDWLRKTELRGAKQVWFVMTCGSEIGNADKYNRELCTESERTPARHGVLHRCRERICFFF